jgi:hypothetical protein
MALEVRRYDEYEPLTPVRHLRLLAAQQVLHRKPCEALAHVTCETRRDSDDWSQTITNYNSCQSCASVKARMLRGN